jgi:hypothetical protein
MMKSVFNRFCYAKHDARRAVSKAGLSGICLCWFAVSASADPVILFDDLYGPTSSVARIRFTYFEAPETPQP